MLEPKKPGDDGTTPTDPTQQQQKELKPGETTTESSGDTDSGTDQPSQ